MTQQTIDRVTEAFSLAVKDIYGDKLDKVILFGSCARGDFQADSDIDLMVLLKVNQTEIKEEKKKIRQLRNQLDRDYDVLTAPIIQSSQTFQQWLPAMPFYQNITKEGKQIA